jgi:hypothetical protein
MTPDREARTVAERKGNPRVERAAREAIASINKRMGRPPETGIRPENRLHPDPEQPKQR